MPLYEYRCPKCGEVVEVIARHDDPPPKCKCGEKMIKAITAHAASSQWGDWRR